jgi:hypothetical protein
MFSPYLPVPVLRSPLYMLRDSSLLSLTIILSQHDQLESQNSRIIIADIISQLLRLPALVDFSETIQEMSPNRTTQLQILDHLQTWMKMIISRHPHLRGRRYIVD